MYYPDSGPSSGNTLIKISGYGFMPFEDNKGHTLKKPVWVRLKNYKSGKYSEIKAA